MRGCLCLLTSPALLIARQGLEVSVDEGVKIVLYDPCKLTLVLTHLKKTRLPDELNSIDSRFITLNWIVYLS